jgi:hypothetical protein
MTVLNPLIPAYLLKGAQPPVVIFRCPECGVVHHHGATGDSPVKWRGADQCVSKSAFRCKNYRPFVCGEVSSLRMLPRTSLAQIETLTLVLDEKPLSKSKAVAPDVPATASRLSATMTGADHV